MKSRWMLSALAVAVAGAALIEGCLGRSTRMGSLVWPPDTIQAVYVGGDTYEVTTVPPVIDPKMKVVLVWPPETTLVAFAAPAGNVGWVPDTTQVQIHFRPLQGLARTGKQSATLDASRSVHVLPWPPDTTVWMLPHSYPTKILLVWPPDTTES